MDLSLFDWARGKVLCPLCSGPLSRVDTTAVCPNRHAFDFAGKGYLNLSPAEGSRHGDDSGMVESRRRFLGAGHYDRLIKTVSEALARNLGEESVILDAGCGEGRYTAGIADANPTFRILALDLSRDAVRATASRPETKTGQIFPIVAGVYRLPIGNESLDGVISAFSPFAREEFLRVLKPGGILLRAIPGAKHLFDLKSVLYEDPYENVVEDYATEGFGFLGTERLSYRILLKNPSEIVDLLNMTPYAYRTPPEGKRRLAALETLSTEVEFEVLTYRKQGQKEEG